MAAPREKNNRKAEFVAVGKAGKAIFSLTPGVQEGSFDSYLFSVDIFKEKNCQSGVRKR